MCAFQRPSDLSDPPPQAVGLPSLWMLPFSRSIAHTMVFGQNSFGSDFTVFSVDLCLFFRKRFLSPVFGDNLRAFVSSDFYGGLDYAD